MNFALRLGTLLAPTLVSVQTEVFEIDETLIDGVYSEGHGRVWKQWVIGILQRSDRRLYVQRVPDRTQPSLCPVVRDHVPAGSLICTDQHAGYNPLHEDYRRYTVNHSIKEFQRIDQLDDGTSLLVTINHLEDAWSELKASLVGHAPREVMRLDRRLKVLMFRHSGRTVLICLLRRSRRQ